MIDELFLYDRDDSLFKSIVQQIGVLEGRYHVSPDYGQDLNTNNLAQYLKDPAYGLTGPSQKYPLCVCITPRSTPIKINGARWEQFFFTLYFLTRTHVDGNNQLKKIDKDTNTSSQNVWTDWSEMKTAALDFLNLLEATLRGMATVDGSEVRFYTIVNIDFEKVGINRLTNFNNDKISGVGMTFNCFLNVNECLVIVDPVTYQVATFEEETDPVWNAEKDNYYDRDEVDALIAGATITETDPVWAAEKSNYYTKSEADAKYAYDHNQNSPAAVWNIIHNLGYKPNPLIIDSAGDQVHGKVEYPSTNALKLTFSAAFAGHAYLS